MIVESCILKLKTPFLRFFLAIAFTSFRLKVVLDNIITLFQICKVSIKLWNVGRLGIQLLQRQFWKLEISPLKNVFQIRFTIFSSFAELQEFEIKRSLHKNLVARSFLSYSYIRT